MEENTMTAIIKVGVILEGPHAGYCTIHIQQEPWGHHKNEVVRVFESESRYLTVQTAERLSQLLRGMPVYYSDRLSAEEFLERAQ